MQFAHAKWESTGNDAPSVQGQCQKCGTIVPAIKLELKRLPFGRGEIWKCKGGC